MTIKSDDQPMIDVQLVFHLDPPHLTAQEVRSLAKRLLAELTMLDPAIDNAFDPAVDTRPERRAILVDLVVPSGGDALACTQHALNIIRTAARRAGFGDLVPAGLHACAIPVPVTS